jgi:hypothetical protein
LKPNAIELDRELERETERIEPDLELERETERIEPDLELERKPDVLKPKLEDEGYVAENPSLRQIEQSKHRRDRNFERLGIGPPRLGRRAVY